MNSTLRGTLFGLLGGVAGLAAMRLYWNLATGLLGEDPRQLTREEPPDALDEMSIVGRQAEEDESSTAAVGRIGYEVAEGHEPPEGLKPELSQAVHWGYGLTMAGLYGALRGVRENRDAPGGLLFGTAMWLLGDELAVPLLGLSEGPTAYPVEQHAHRLGAHLAYGLTVAAVTQSLLAVDEARRRPARLGWKAAKKYAQWRLLKGAGKAAWRAVR